MSVTTRESGGCSVTASYTTIQTVLTVEVRAGLETPSKFEASTSLSEDGPCATVATFRHIFRQ